MCTKSPLEQLELQNAVRMNSKELVDIHFDMQNWERQIKLEEKRNKSSPEVSQGLNEQPFFVGFRIFSGYFVLNFLLNLI